MATLREHLQSCKKLLEEHPEALDLPMYGVVGSSGVSHEVNSPHVAKVGNYEQGDLLWLNLGEEYVCIYLGN